MTAKKISKAKRILSKIEEMSRNDRKTAEKALDSDRKIILGTHLIKWLMWEGSEAHWQKEIQAFFVDLFLKMVRESSREKSKVQGVSFVTKTWFTPKQVMKELDGVTAASVLNTEMQMKTKPTKNLEMPDLDWFSDMGFGIGLYRNDSTGLNWILYWNKQVIANTANRKKG